jgi:hypothetical protein
MTVAGSGNSGVVNYGRGGSDLLTRKRRGEKERKRKERKGKEEEGESEREDDDDEMERREPTKKSRPFVKMSSQQEVTWGNLVFNYRV